MRPTLIPAKFARAAAHPLAFALLSGAGAIAAFWHFHAQGAPGADLFVAALAVGFLAQLIDGALGMAYGISATTLLLAGGATPLGATAAVHVAEIFTSGASSLVHWRAGNVNRTLFLRLLVPGMIGAIAGAWLATRIDGNALRPWVSAYLLLMGVYVVARALRRRTHLQAADCKAPGALAFSGGFVDAIGGGGWGPVVASTLLGSGHTPRSTIGTVNAVEFFVTLASGLSFVLLAGISRWEPVAGLVAGGLIAAPFAAQLTARLPARALMLAVGLMVSALSAYGLVRALA